VRGIIRIANAALATIPRVRGHRDPSAQRDHSESIDRSIGFVNGVSRMHLKVSQSRALYSRRGCARNVARRAAAVIAAASLLR
jgi:hypothetical protein